MEEKIIEILRKWNKPIFETKAIIVWGVASETFDEVADEIEKLFQQEYLNSCIEKATPALSKIKDVDKELAEIKGENNCDNCIWGKCLTADWPCFDCDGSNKWEPIKTE